MSVDKLARGGQPKIIKVCYEMEDLSDFGILLAKKKRIVKSIITYQNLNLFCIYYFLLTQVSRPNAFFLFSSLDNL